MCYIFDKLATGEHDTIIEWVRADQRRWFRRLLLSNSVAHQNLRISFPTFLPECHRPRLNRALSCSSWFTSGNTSSVDFFDNVFTFLNESVTVNCCHQNNTIELASCGLGASCAGSCSALGASLCPSGNCAGDCEVPFEQETNEIESQRQPFASKPASKFKWCSARCNVWKHKGCCYNPVCRKRSASHRRACRWFNYLTGVIMNSLFSSWELTVNFQEKLVLSLASCPMAVGVVKCKRSQSRAPPSWTKMHSHTQVS